LLRISKPCPAAFLWSINVTATQTSETGSISAETIVSLIQAGDPRGEELLYSVFTRGLRYLAIRKLGYEEADEVVHDTFIALSQKIKEGALREPAALFKYARTILERMIGNRYTERRKWQRDVDFEVVAGTHADSALTPEKAMESAMRTQVMQEGLASLRPREREILVRFYLQEQDQERIRREMNLTDTQYRLLKSRSKQKLGEFATSYMKSPERTAPLPCNFEPPVHFEAPVHSWAN
jgi:RNA polymerase sigma-70 factor (ECF subfamily)